MPFMCKQASRLRHGFMGPSASLPLGDWTAHQTGPHAERLLPQEVSILLPTISQPYPKTYFDQM